MSHDLRWPSGQNVIWLVVLGSLPDVTPLLNLLIKSLGKANIKFSQFLMWLHVTTRVKEYMTLLVIDCHCKTSTCTFVCNWSTESGDMMYVIRHTISQDHVIAEWVILTVIYFFSKFAGDMHCSSRYMIIVIEKQYSTCWFNFRRLD